MKLPYLDAVVKESVARENCEEIPLSKADGTKQYVIPKGSAVYFYPHLASQGGPGSVKMQDFVPERFLKTKKTGAEKSVHSWFMPFSVGPRDCVGRPLALAELKHILFHTIHRYRVRRTEGSNDPIKMMLIAIKARQMMVDCEQRR